MLNSPKVRFITSTSHSCTVLRSSWKPLPPLLTSALLPPAAGSGPAHNSADPRLLPSCSNGSTTGHLLPSVCGRTVGLLPMVSRACLKAKPSLFGLALADLPEEDCVGLWDLGEEVPGDGLGDELALGLGGGAQGVRSGAQACNGSYLKRLEFVTPNNSKPNTHLAPPPIAHFPLRAPTCRLTCTGKPNMTTKRPCAFAQRHPTVQFKKRQITCMLRRTEVGKAIEMVSHPWGKHLAIYLFKRRH